MQAYEFYTKPENGVILIPEQYRHQISSNVMVIILDKTPRKVTSMKRKTDLLSPPVLKTKGWKFNREEANER